MIYCQLKGRVSLDPGAPLTLGQVARIIAPSPADQLSLSCPDKPGVWRITPVNIAPVLQTRFPQETISFIGPDACYVHRFKKPAHDHWKWLRTAFAFAILFLGSTLGMAWFHSDVDMPSAQMMVYQLVTSREVSDPRQITYPYIIGVACGVCVFYALPSRSRSTPMEVKLSTYLSSMEQTEGEDVHD